MQAQTVEQAAPRKQNIACDACRTRKVKCVMIPSQEKCQHCQAKSYPCTFNVQRETSEKKRQGTARRRNSESTTGAIQNSSTFSSSLSGSTSPVPVAQPSAYPESSPSGSIPSYYPNAFQALASRTQPLEPLDSTSANTQFIPSSLALQPPAQQAFPETPTTQLIAYLLSPEDPATLKGYRALPDYQRHHKLQLDDWGEVGLKLQDPAFRIEFALDLVEVYFEICHTRIALLGPARFRAQLRASLPSSTAACAGPASPPSPDVVNPAILATVLAWGAKFSEHPLIVQDRAADTSGARRSRLANSLTKKAREVSEAEKMHIVPSADAVIVCMLLDGLHSHNTTEPDGYRSFWLNCALRHLIYLQVNNRSAAPGLIEPDRRDAMVYAWWMACLADSFSSAYFRRKPVLEDNDYNIGFYPQDITRIAQSEAAGPGSEKQLEVVTRPEFLAWYAASHAMARCAREMSRQLWRPSTQSEGIPFAVLCALITQLRAWRSAHLDTVGVPGVQVNWDFLAAVAACAQDSTFHIMWVILFQALREFGLREVNEMKQARPGDESAYPLAAQFAATEAQVREEALNGASRIAGLTNLLTQSSYLRLDPNFMHFSIYAAGKLLAEFGREEVGMCVRGLQQYGVAYEDALDQAVELQRMYAAAAARPEAAPQVWDGVSVNGAHGHAAYPVVDGAEYGRSSTLAPLQRRL